MNKKYASLETPVYIVSLEKLINNAKIIKRVIDETGCKVLLAQKAFSMYSTYPYIKEFLSGTTASGLFEAKLGFEEMQKENHIFSAAYIEKDFDEILRITDHLVFNSFNEWYKYKDRVIKANKSAGIRINPECSTQKGAIYDPCSKGSRLGVKFQDFVNQDLTGIEGLHFHTLCEQNSDDLVTTLNAFEEKFGPYISKMKWINFGGGHHITRSDYDIELLIKTINDFKKRYNVEVYLEPGEAFAYYAGVLVTKVLDIVNNDGDIALLDASAACHMPDVIEMPYRPPLFNSGKENELEFTYTLAGATCLAGDVIGRYSFKDKLNIGDILVFEDMAIYSMVKNNTFNGINLPSIAIEKLDGSIEVIKKFGYEDFKMRL